MATETRECKKCGKVKPFTKEYWGLSLKTDDKVYFRRECKACFNLDRRKDRGAPLKGGSGDYDGEPPAELPKDRTPWREPDGSYSCSTCGMNYGSDHHQTATDCCNPEVLTDAKPRRGAQVGGRQVTPEEQAELVRLLNSGYTYKEASAELGFSCEHLKAICNWESRKLGRRLGIRGHRARAAWRAEQRAKGA